MKKTTDDLLISCDRTQIDSFLYELNKRFDVGKSLIAAKHGFNGCKIHSSPDSVVFKIPEYLARLKHIYNSRSCPREQHLRDTAREMSKCRTVAGSSYISGTLYYLHPPSLHRLCSNATVAFRSDMHPIPTLWYPTCYVSTPKSNSSVPVIYPSPNFSSSQTPLTVVLNSILVR